MKLLTGIFSKKKIGDDANAAKAQPVVHKAWENANIAQLACDDAKGWEACKDVVAEGEKAVNVSLASLTYAFYTVLCMHHTHIYYPPTPNVPRASLRLFRNDRGGFQLPV